MIIMIMTPILIFLLLLYIYQKEGLILVLYKEERIIVDIVQEKEPMLAVQQL